MDKKIVLEFIDYSINRVIDSWRLEIKEMKEGGCGTFLMSPNPFEYEESHIKELEEIRKYIYDNLK